MEGRPIDYRPPATIAPPHDDTSREAARTTRALTIWREAGPIAGTIAEVYLWSRGITLDAWPVALRFHPCCPRPKDDHGNRLPAMPAMVGVVEHTERGLVAVHCTYLRRDGSGKAAVEPDKAFFGPVSGGAVRLGMPRDGEWLAVAEGIETALSIASACAVPAWAALSARGIKNVLLPSEAHMVLICADNDASGVSASSLRGAASSSPCRPNRERISTTCYAARRYRTSRRCAVLPHSPGAMAVRDLFDSAPEVKPRLWPLPISEFLKLELPPRRNILKPWLPEKSTTMIYSPRGVGKTHLALAIGYVIASASEMLGWQAVEPRRVLYVDGEMPSEALQARLAAIVAGFDKEPPAPDYFRMLSADLTEGGLPDLATKNGQREFDGHIGDAVVLILDNISTLCRSGKENEAESWVSVQEWALSQRRTGRSIVFVHHAGKGGEQRGTSKREDVLDTVLALRRPQDYTANQGARFELHFEKSRGFHGSEAEPFEARYEVRDGAAVWTRTAITDAELARVADAIRDGMSIREAAATLGMHRSKVERLKRRAVDEGLING